MHANNFVVVVVINVPAVPSHPTTLLPVDCGWCSATVETKSSNMTSASESSSSLDSTAGELPSCRPLYQSATVDIYARFVMADIRHGSPPYMLHRKALFRLTDLLRGRIRVSDESVARLRGGTVVDGLKPGVTEIQVHWITIQSL